MLGLSQVILHKKIGSFISEFKSKDHVMQKMYKARAKMKMYAENTSHADGHNLPRYEKARNIGNVSSQPPRAFLIGRISSDLSPQCRRRRARSTRSLSRI